MADFLVKSSFGVSIVSVLILIPFGINNFFQDRTLDGAITIFVTILFAANAAVGWRGRYALYFNLFGIVPALTLASANALLTLQVIGSYWSYLCLFAIYFILPFQYTKYANFAFLTFVISAAVVALDPDIALRFSVVLVGASIFIFISNKQTVSAYEQLHKQAITDALTETLNRVSMPEKLDKTIRQYKNKGIKSTLCIIDIDHFKKINDTFGHDAGDKVLVDLAAYIQGQITPQDTLFRIGGEEFLIVMTDLGIKEGKRTADTIRALIEKLTLIENHQVTISVGVTEVDHYSDWKQWMKRSDEQLYLAKEKGRNQVVG
jgi:diguanylate cyclase (GGDEF)-like protein